MNKKNVKYLVMDVDGTLTDGKIYMSPYGETCKAFNTKDGYGIHDLIIPAGIIPIIITGRKSEIVEKRCDEIGICDIYQGVVSKEKILEQIVENLEQVAYIGDDVNDLSCIEIVKKAGGIVGCPGDAAKQVANLSDYISTKNGGDGAVREFIEWLLDV